MVDSVQGADQSSRILPILAAVGLGFVYILAVGIALDSAERAQFALWAAFPVAQIAYVAPMAYVAKKNGRRRALQGWIIGAAIAAVIYAPCWGLALMSQPGGFHG